MIRQFDSCIHQLNQTFKRKSPIEFQGFLHFVSKTALHPLSAQLLTTLMWLLLATSAMASKRCRMLSLTLP